MVEIFYLNFRISWCHLWVAIKIGNSLLYHEISLDPNSDSTRTAIRLLEIKAAQVLYVCKRTYFLFGQNEKGSNSNISTVIALRLIIIL